MARSEQIAFDNPEAYISRDRRRALAAGREMPDRVRGAALLADISGFTPLTEALAAELGPQRGAEELTANLDRVFECIVDELDRFGGDIIYFSGDAITCWLEGDDGSRATACGLAMQRALARAGEIVTPHGTTVRIAMKVAVAVGPARRFVVGDPEIQLIDVLAGRLVDQLAAAEQQAEKGEVVLEQSALESLSDAIELASRRLDAASGRAVGVVTHLARDVATVAAGEPQPPLSEELVRPWILQPVYERLRAGRGEFLAELRPAIPVFVRFGGIDYDDDDAAAEKLDDFVRRTQRIFHRYGGNLLQLTLGDKGAYLYGVFGAPLAHEDDAARAAAAALDLSALDGVTAASGFQVGIAHGRLRSGTYGHSGRRTFVCLGDAVNLAARLMTSSPPGHVYVAEAVQRQAGESFTWERLPDLLVKGKAEPVAAYALTGAARRASRSRQGGALQLVGRRDELLALDAALASALDEHGCAVGIAGEAGMGKSRLVAEFVHAASGAGVVVGECPAFGANASYYVWQEIWRSLLRVDDGQPDDVQVAAVERELAAIEPALVQRVPLLGPLLGIAIPDNELTAAFDAKLRKASLEDLLAECLRARSRERPLVLVLEDCHWIDPLSRDLLEVLVRAAAELPVLVVLAYRPDGAPGLEHLPQFMQIDLAELEQADTEQLIRAKAEQLFGDGTAVPAALVELVTDRSEGNPFYAEELLSYIRGTGFDPQDDAALRALQLPESMHSLILSRVDTLAEDPRRTLKVASVVGRSFRAAALPGIYPELGSHDDVLRHLGTLVSLDLMAVDGAADGTYLFKNGVTQEVTYESLPFAIRADLHARAGGYIEETEPDSIALHLDLLAHHYWHSGDLEKKRSYLVLAGEAAQANYANAAAIDYFERVAPLLAGEHAQVDVLLKLGKVLELVGDWPRSEQVERAAHAQAQVLGDDRSGAWCEAALAELARKQGRFEEARGLLATAAESFEAAGDEAGVGQVYHQAGTLAAQQGQYDTAVQQYEASLEIRERLDDRVSMAALLSNLGIVAEYRGDYDASWEYHERALELRTAVGDRQAISVSMTNLGAIAVLRHDNEEARRQFEESMRLNREIGDAWMVAINHNNLGNATRGLGDYDTARAHYADSLVAYRDYDDRWSLAFLLEDIGQLAALTGEAERAFELVGAADELREQIGAPRAPALDGELEAQLAHARDALDPDAREAARRRGRELDLGQAIERAAAACTVA